MPIYVIQKHKATHLHFDLRLQKGNILKSWALPKRPPGRSGIKRLAVQVPDHAKSYASFEGKIEKGYGKGIVKIWDKGSYRPISIKPGKWVVDIRGKRLKGKYVLLRFRSKNWLFFKKKK